MASFCCNPLFSQTIEVTQLIESGKNHWIFHDSWSADQWCCWCWHIHKPLVDEIAATILMILYLWLQIPNELGKSAAHSVDHHHLSFTTTNKIDALWYFFPDIFSLQSSFWPFIFNFENSHFTTKISFACSVGWLDNNCLSCRPQRTLTFWMN